MKTMLPSERVRHLCCAGPTRRLFGRSGTAGEVSQAERELGGSQARATDRRLVSRSRASRAAQTRL
jgi:hypothetical protein